MDGKFAATKFLGKLFDTSQPFLYVLVLPPLVLFALGYRRFSLLYFLGAAAVFAVFSLE